MIRPKPKHVDGRLGGLRERALALERASLRRVADAATRAARDATLIGGEPL
jgi:hypothetical protein